MLNKDPGPLTKDPKIGASPEPEEDGDDARMTFTEHLGELRTRIIRIGISLAVTFAITFVWQYMYNGIFDLISRPLRGLGEDGPQWVTLSPIEYFMVSLKLSAYGALALALPFIVYQLLAFVFPGLKKNERRAVQMLVTGCTVLATGGVLMAYFLVFPFVLTYLMQFAPEYVRSDLRLNETVALILKGLLGFAVVFQFPMIIFVLVYLDLLSPATLKAHRKMMVIVIFVAAAFFTPPDPYTMMFVGLPLYFLYEVSIFFASLMVKRRNKKAKAGG
ncbi:MAG: twin-arginine translocase subunit TatC [Candidatus Hydrogenedentes bacterium]|nr:twin-arginine translocase subunit TatC [Candidatus Hydrogenedentota bacterium]